MKKITKKQLAAPIVETWEPDAFVIRTTDANAKAYGDYQWTKEIGAIVDCPDWKPTTECGNGFHGLLGGVGDWEWTSSRHDALWWVVGVKRAECIDLCGKVKFPKCKILYVGGINGALSQLASEWKLEAAKVLESATSGNSSPSATSGDYSHSSTSGNSSPSATSGYSSHSATSGDSSHSSTSGYYSHSSTSGYYSNASAIGDKSVAAAIGYNSKAKAGASGAICVVCYDSDLNILAIRASKVGENGIKAGVFYSLSKDGEFIEDNAE